MTGLKLSKNTVQILVPTISRRDPEGRRLSCSGRQTARVEELGGQATGGPRPYLSCPCAILDHEAAERAPTGQKALLRPKEAQRCFTHRITIPRPWVVGVKHSWGGWASLEPVVAE